MRGKGELVLTGQLGDIMKESARAALTYAKSHAELLGIPEGAFVDTDIHVHVPAGAIPTDRPSESRWRQRRDQRRRHRDSEGRSVGRNHDGDGAGLCAV